MSSAMSGGRDRCVLDRLVLVGGSCCADERARTKRSRRCRASAIVGSTPRSWAESSKTARTRSATRSAGTLPSSSADRVAVITAESRLLSLFIGGLTAVCEVECGSRANSDRPLAKVVAGVVERMGMSVPRWAHPCRSDRPWGCVCRVVARRRSQEPVAFDKTCRSVAWFPRRLIHSDLISVVQRRRTGLPRFGSSTTQARSHPCEPPRDRHPAVVLR